MQVTYNHHPLYTFAKDKKAGQTNGEGVNAFGAEWYVISPAGSKIDKGSSSGGNATPAPKPTHRRRGRAAVFGAALSCVESFDRTKD